MRVNRQFRFHLEAKADRGNILQQGSFGSGNALGTGPFDVYHIGAEKPAIRSSFTHINSIGGIAEKLYGPPAMDLNRRNPLQSLLINYRVNRLTGKVAVVTGASKGIGASIAEHLGAEGARVVVNYATSRQGADEVVRRIEAKGGEAAAVQADVSKEEDIAKLFAETKSRFGTLDILVNNAGVYEFSPLEAVTPEHFYKQFNLNVLGLLLTTKEAVKLIGPAGGTIINISSIVGPMPMPMASVYSATKAAVDAITISLSRELGPKKIRVNALNPGMVLTEGVQSAGFAESDFRKQMEQQTPLGGIAQPEDIGRAAVFFASDDSGWVSGQTLIVAGGLRQ